MITQVATPRPFIFPGLAFQKPRKANTQVNSKALQVKAISDLEEKERQWAQKDRLYEVKDLEFEMKCRQHNLELIKIKVEYLLIIGAITKKEGREHVKAAAERLDSDMGWNLYKCLGEIALRENRKQNTKFRLLDIQAQRRSDQAIAHYSLTARLVVLAKELYRIGDMEGDGDFFTVWNDFGGVRKRNKDGSLIPWKIKPSDMSVFARWFLNRLMNKHPAYTSPEAAEERITGLLQKLDHLKPMIP